MGAIDELAPTAGLFDGDSLKGLEWLPQRPPPSVGQMPQVQNHPTEKLTVSGVFAGIGGLEEGFRRAGYASGMSCELDPLARAVLKRPFPDPATRAYLPTSS